MVPIERLFHSFYTLATVVGADIPDGTQVKMQALVDCMTKSSQGAACLRFNEFPRIRRIDVSRTCYIAVDLGAESGQTMLGKWVMAGSQSKRFIDSQISKFISLQVFTGTHLTSFNEICNGLCLAQRN